MSSSVQAIDLFLAHVDAPERFAKDTELAATLAELIHRGQQAWPNLDLPLEKFVQHLAVHVPHLGTKVTLREVHAEDLYLACACAHKITAAVESFEREILCRVPVPQELQTEVRQLLRERLLVPEERTRTPRIASYGGRGPLKAWVAIAAKRLTIDVQRTRQQQNQQEVYGTPIEQIAGGADPHRSFLTERYRKEYEEAFQQGLANLTERQRMALRLRYIEGLSGAQMGKRLAVDKATANRWVTDAEQSLLLYIRTTMQKRLGISTQEFQSLAAALRSQMQISIHSALCKG